jgi:DNA-binding Xre family transcriptional regulator
MRLVEFDGHKFADDVAAAVKAMKHGQQRVLRYTGISTATLCRIVNQGHAVKDISTILSLCAFLRLSVKDYILV